LSSLPEPIWRRRLESEFEEMRESGERFESNAELTEYVVSLKGPALYRESGRIFQRDSHSVKIELLRGYPYPGGIDVTWLTPIFHPNIREADGKVCIQLLNDWAENQTVLSLVKSLRHLLANPNPADPLNKEAAAYFLSNPDALYALPKPAKPRIVLK
jgi:ubiquitin-protein ligase